MTSPAPTHSLLLDSTALDFSIVIPTYNRPRLLEQCLRSLSRLRYPRERFEVIVVDDGSPSDLQSCVGRHSALLNLTFLRQSNAGPARARNAGVQAALGRYVLFLDDDCQPDPEWLEKLRELMHHYPGCAIGGTSINGLTGNVYSDASQELVHYLYECWNRADGEAYFLTSNNLGFPRDRFLQIGGFDESFPRAAAEDRELCDRWIYSGGRIMHTPDAIVIHRHSLGLLGFVCQQFNYARGAAQFHFKRARRGGVRPRLLPLARMLSYPFQRRVRHPLKTSSLLLLAQLLLPLGLAAGLLDECRERILESWRSGADSKASSPVNRSDSWTP